MVTLEQVVTLQKPTNNFLCPLDANTYNIDFIAFKIRSLDAVNPGIIFQIRKDPDARESSDVEINAAGMAMGDDCDKGRMIRYHFGPKFLDCKTVGTELEFSIGDTPLTNFRMIERHYFRDRIIKSFDFTLPFCIPNTTNTWEVIYTMPDLDPVLKQQIIENPWETRSDSFYFVENQMVMHNKAEYNYGP